MKYLYTDQPIILRCFHHLWGLDLLAFFDRLSWVWFFGVYYLNLLFADPLNQSNQIIQCSLHSFSKVVWKMYFTYWLNSIGDQILPHRTAWLPPYYLWINCYWVNASNTDLIFCVPLITCWNHHFKIYKNALQTCTICIWGLVPGFHLVEYLLL